MNSLSGYLTRFQKKLLLVLANISLLFFAHSVMRIKWVHVNAVDFLGLASHLPFAYWIGLGAVIFCLLIVFSSKIEYSKYIMLYLLIILGLYLFGLGTFAHDVVRNYTSYYPAGEVNTILASSHIDISSQYPLISYRSWPAVHIISASILLITGVGFIDLIKYMPLFWLVNFIIITFSIGCNYLSVNYRFLLSILSLSAFWSSQDYYSPQSLALIIYILIFTIAINFIIKENVYKDKLLIIFFIFLTFNHMLTSLTAYLSIILFNKNYKKIRLIILSIFLISWYIYLAPVVLDWGIPDFIRKTLELEFFSTVGNKLNSNSTIESLIKYIQMIYISVFLCSTAISLVIYRYYKINTLEKKLFKNVYLWLSGITPLIIIVYGSEIIERIYIYSVVPLTFLLILAIKNINFSTKIFKVIIIVFVALNIPAHYGNESFGTGSLPELAGAKFLSLKAIMQDPHIDNYLYHFDKYIWYYNNSLVRYKHTTLCGLDISNPNVFNSIFIINSRQTNNILIFRFGFNYLGRWIELNKINLNHLYSNGEFEIFKNKWID